MTMNTSSHNTPAKAGQALTAPRAPVFVAEVEDEVYRAENGYTARREDGLTPNGNPIAQRWVLRDAAGAWVDMNQYRFDLFEHNGLTPRFAADRRIPQRTEGVDHGLQ